MKSFQLSKFLRYPFKRQKKNLFVFFGFSIVTYLCVQLMFIPDEFSPLKPLSSVEKEASRLLKLITQIHVNCNDSTPTSNMSLWLICHEFGNDKPGGVAYSVGPHGDLSFERFLPRNLSYKMFIFTQDNNKVHQLSKSSNQTFIIKISIVANDPSDFARNSYDTKTLNVGMDFLKHKNIDVLKLDTFVHPAVPHEVLKFLIQDGLLSRVKELHVKLSLEKVDEDTLYSWYRVLYYLFETAGFRLYHTATSDPLCVQDTVMESCIYYLSWITKPKPRVYVLYPPALTGLYESEQDRVLSYLRESADRKTSFQTRKTPYKMIIDEYRIPYNIYIADVLFKSSTNNHHCNIILIVSDLSENTNDNSVSMNSPCDVYVYLVSKIEETNTDQYDIFFLNKTGKIQHKKKVQPSLLNLKKIQNSLDYKAMNILVLWLDGVYDLLHMILNLELPKAFKQVTIQSQLFPAVSKRAASTLRHRYSELRRLEAYGFLLVSPTPGQATVTSHSQVTPLHFLKKSYLD